MKYIGIDPGVSGALCVLDGDTKDVQFFDTPTLQIKSGKKTRNVQDPHTIVSILQVVSANEDVIVTIEKVQAMPGRDEQGEASRSMGATSAFNFGFGFGMWIGIITALCLPMQQVHPMTWKKSVMMGMGKEKDASRQKAMQLYPKAAKDLQLKKHHGRADALLIAHWASFNIGIRAA